jgi:hypothetical protein
MDMKRAWGAFTHAGTPTVAGLAPWLPYNGTGSIMSLRAGRESRRISDKQFRVEHQCDFWDKQGR